MNYLRKTELAVNYRNTVQNREDTADESSSSFTPVEQKIVSLISQGYHYTMLKDALGTNSETILQLLSNIIRKRAGKPQEGQS